MQQHALESLPKNFLTSPTHSCSLRECVGLALTLVKVLIVFVVDIFKFESLLEHICPFGNNGEKKFASRS